MVNIFKKRTIITTLLILFIILTNSIIVSSYDLIKNPYKYGSKGIIGVAPTNITEDANDAFLISEYKDWKEHYVTEDGAGTYSIYGTPVSCLRVKRDAATNDDTVSEGQAYGMLLALYFNDKDTFSKLYYYAIKHFAGNNGNQGLMHWKINSEGEAVSEFRIPVKPDPHGISYLRKIQQDWDEEDKIYEVYDDFYKPGFTNGNDGDDIVKVELDSGKIITYLKSAEFGRSSGSATDADLDMAGALVFAWYKWGDDFYRDQAAKMIENIFRWDVLPDGFLKNGSLWGTVDNWNPCYFTPAWFEVYRKFIKDNMDGSCGWGNGTPSAASLTNIMTNPMGDYWRLREINIKMYQHINLIDEANGDSGIFPDWAQSICDNGNPISIQKPANGTDRMYWSEVTNPKDDPTDWIWTKYPDADFDGQPYYQKSSYNHYYDAVRMPWRLANHYNWYGDNSYLNHYPSNMCDESTRFFISECNSGHGLLDGYSIDGSEWKWEDRDGFNFAYGGQESNDYKYWMRSPSITFLAMYSLAPMCSNYWDSGFTIQNYNVLKDRKEDYNNKYHYYGNTLRLISLLYMSGKFINYADLDRSVYY